MLSRLLQMFTVAGIGLLATLSPAAAQSPSCQNWREELASLQGQRSGGDPRAAQAVGAELSRSINQFRAMGCERSQFSFFSEAPPPGCAQLQGRIGQLQARFASLQQQGGNGTERRRAQLASLIENNCQRGVYQTPEPQRTQQPQQRGFFEALFGIEPDRSRRPMPELDVSEPQLLQPGDQELEKQRWGAGRPVCVRTCDGFFFPLSNSPGGRESQNDMCQALCPAAETAVFYMSGDGDIESATGRNGQSYTSLANASRYTRGFDASCSCRKTGETWRAALRDAEDMLDRRRGDVIVSEKRAAELSQPRQDNRAETRRRQQAKVDVPPVDELPMNSTNSPTASNDSAGVGPQGAGVGPTLRQGLGVLREVQTADGEKRTVRVVAPGIAPQAAP